MTPEELVDACYEELVQASLADKGKVVKILSSYLETYRGDVIKMLIKKRAETRAPMTVKKNLVMAQPKPFRRDS